VTPKLARGQRIEGVRDARSEVRAALDRAQRFLGLASLLSVVLASVAVALAARRFSQRQTDAAAMMRCLGASQATSSRSTPGSSWCWAWSAARWARSRGLRSASRACVLAHGFFQVALPLPGATPALQGAVIGFVLLAGLHAAAAAAASQCVDAASPSPRSRARGAALHRRIPARLAALAALIIWQAGDVKLGAITMAGFAIAMAVAAILGYGLILLASRLRGAAPGPWRYGLANLRRRTGGSLVQIMALGLGIMAMVLLTLVRSDLLVKWQQSMPADMPNRFAINIQGDQLPELQKYFAEKKLATPDLYPMIRGRLMQINERKVSAADYKEERAKRLVEREFNLSYATRRAPTTRSSAAPSGSRVRRSRSSPSRRASPRRSRSRWATASPTRSPARSSRRR
jgi:putative ABC transport system permease protein